MLKTWMFVVADDQMTIEKMKTLGQQQGCVVKSFSTSEWARGVNDASFRAQLTGELTSLVVGTNPVEEGAKILQFPSPAASLSHSDSDKKVRTINELESLAIENAIQEYGGNLTEAAKALGIGRATLYRKVKQYNIDPADARRKKAA